MERQEFLKELTPFFIKHGYRSFSIDDIVKEFSISKKTLYKFFRNKKELIDAVLIYELEHMETIFKEGSKKPDFFDNIDYVLHHIFDFESAGRQNRNFQQLKKYYHALYEKQVERTYELVFKMVKDLTIRGKKENVVKEDIEPHDIAHIFANSYNSLITMPYEKENKSDILIENYIDLFVQGILTPKGYEKYIVRK